jgi:hypothetical protein
LRAGLQAVDVSGCPEDFRAAWTDYVAIRSLPDNGVKNLVAMSMEASTGHELLALGTLGKQIAENKAHDWHPAFQRLLAVAKKHGVCPP